MDEAEKLIREVQPARADGVAVPWRAPDGYIHLSVAMAQMWNALYRGAWDDWQDCYGPIVEGCNAAALGVAITGPTDNDEGDHLVRFLTDTFRKEVALTAHRQIGGGGPVEKIPGDWWDVEDLDLRFRTWSIDPADRLSQRVELPHWIWVEAASFRRALRQVARARAGGGLPMGYFAEHWPMFSAAAATLSLAQPPISQPGMALLMLCQSGAVQAQAGVMEQVYRGEVVLRENLWEIPSEVWQRVASGDPKNSVLAGTFFSFDGDTTRILHDVMIEAASLSQYLLGHGYSLPDAKDTHIGSPDAEEPARSARPPGPDPYKAYPLLKQVFEAHHEKLSNCASENERHRYLRKLWPGIASKVGRDSCPGRAVVTRCWERYVTTRHQPAVCGTHSPC